MRRGRRAARAPGRSRRPRRPRCRPSFGRAAHGQRVDPAGVRPVPRRPLPRRPGRRGARGHRGARRRVLDQPRRLDQPDRDLVAPASGSTGSPTIRTRSSAGARPTTASTSSSGIAEVNLVGLLGELGATWSRDGQPLLPIGTIYDPFVTRAHEPWSFGIYAGGQSILVGTPSGVTLGPGGRRPPVGRDAVDRHRAAGLRRVGAGVRAGPRVDAAARAGRLGRPDGTARTSACRRGRSTRRSPRCPRTTPAASARRADVLAGGYVLREGGRAA